MFPAEGAQSILLSVNRILASSSSTTSTVASRPQRFVLLLTLRPERSSCLLVPSVKTEAAQSDDEVRAVTFQSECTLATPRGTPTSARGSSPPITWPDAAPLAHLRRLC